MKEKAFAIAMQDSLSQKLWREEDKLTAKEVEVTNLKNEVANLKRDAVEMEESLKQEAKRARHVARKYIFEVVMAAARGRLEIARKLSLRYKDDDETKGERRHNGRIEKHPMLLLPP